MLNTCITFECGSVVKCKRLIIHSYALVHYFLYINTLLEVLREFRYLYKKQLLFYRKFLYVTNYLTSNKIDMIG